MCTRAHTPSQPQHEQWAYLRLSLLSLCLFWNLLSGLSGLLKFSEAERGLDFQISQCDSDLRRAQSSGMTCNSSQGPLPETVSSVHTRAVCAVPLDGTSHWLV